jgi:hypothetical protein
VEKREDRGEERVKWRWLAYGLVYIKKIYDFDTTFVFI